MSISALASIFASAVFKKTAGVFARALLPLAACAWAVGFMIGRFDDLTARTYADGVEAGRTACVAEQAATIELARKETAARLAAERARLRAERTAAEAEIEKWRLAYDEAEQAARAGDDAWAACMRLDVPGGLRLGPAVGANPRAD